MCITLQNSIKMIKIVIKWKMLKFDFMRIWGNNGKRIKIMVNNV